MQGWKLIASIAVILVIGMVGCGDDGGDSAESDTSEAEAQIILDVSGSGDRSTTEDTWVIRGTVDPADATVRVDGKRAPVNDTGSFRTEVQSPDPGESRSIRILAQAEGFGSASDTVRITHRLTEAERQALAAERAARREAREQARLQRQAEREAARAARQAEKEAQEAAEQAEDESASNCDPNYAGACLDPSSADYDCAGGSGDGPDYTGRVEVVGSDVHGLDADGDGVACE